MRIAALSLLTLTASIYLSTAAAKETANKPVQDKHDPQKSEDAAEITFTDLKFEIAKDAQFDRKMLGEKVESLAGKRIKVTGSFLPTSVYMREGIKTFILQNNDIKHNHSAPLPKMDEVIRVEMEGDRTTTFTSQPIAVEGEFSIKEWAVINGRPAAVYHLKATSVTPQQIDPVKK